MPSQRKSSSTARSDSAVERSRSVSSTRSAMTPPCPRANSQLKSAVRAPPMCREPVGLGAKRTRTTESDTGSSVRETARTRTGHPKVACMRKRDARGYASTSGSEPHDTLVHHGRAGPEVRQIDARRHAASSVVHSIPRDHEAARGRRTVDQAAYARATHVVELEHGARALRQALRKSESEGLRARARVGVRVRQIDPVRRFARRKD